MLLDEQQVLRNFSNKLAQLQQEMARSAVIRVDHILEEVFLKGTVRDPRFERSGPVATALTSVPCLWRTFEY